MLSPKKYCVSMHVMNLFQHLFVSFLKVLMGRTKDKPFVRTENLSSDKIATCVQCISSVRYFIFKGV